MTRGFETRSRGEVIFDEQARRAWAADRTATAKERAALRRLAAQGIRPHYGSTPWDPAELRQCEPGCWAHHQGY